MSIEIVTPPALILRLYFACLNNSFLIENIAHLPQLLHLQQT